MLTVAWGVCCDMETSRNLEPSFEVSTSWESSAVLLWLLTKMSKATNDRCAQHKKTHAIVGHLLGLRKKLTSVAVDSQGVWQIWFRANLHVGFLFRLQQPRSGTSNRFRHDGRVLGLTIVWRPSYYLSRTNGGKALRKAAMKV